MFYQGMQLRYTSQVLVELSYMTKLSIKDTNQHIHSKSVATLVKDAKAGTPILHQAQIKY